MNRDLVEEWLCCISLSKEMSARGWKIIATYSGYVMSKVTTDYESQA